MMGLYGKELVWHTQSSEPHSRPNKNNMGFSFSQMHVLSPMQGLTAKIVTSFKMLLLPLYRRKGKEGPPEEWEGFISNR